MTEPNPYPRGTLAHDAHNLATAFRPLRDAVVDGLTRVADRVLGGPVPLDDRTRAVVGIAQAGEAAARRGLSVRPANPPVGTPQLTYAERVWLMAPATPWTLDLIRAAWTDDEAIEAAERALRDEVDPEAIADALLAYVDQRDRRHDVEADALVDEWAVGR